MNASLAACECTASPADPFILRYEGPTCETPVYDPSTRINATVDRAPLGEPYPILLIQV